MKNLKKVLALALVFAMTLTLFAGAAFIDQDSIGIDYVDDVNMLVELGVLKGYNDNSFQPEKNVTRAEFAKMAYTLKYGQDDQGQLFVGQKSAFVDVEGVSSIAWAKGYINYCANQKVISGVGANKFNPNGNVTVAEAAKMLLVILGCDPQTEGLVGANWQGNTVAKAIELGIFDGWVGDPTAPASRQLVAKLMRNAIFAPTYAYSPITGAGSQKQVLDPTLDNPTLGESTMGLLHETGIVVANERYALETNDEGEALPAVKATDDEDRSVIAFETADKDVWDTLTINVGLSDDMLGNLVDVYYVYDKDTKQYEVLGNVLVSAKTVIYDVAASDIEIMPNGESRKNGDVKPEIVFTTEDGEYSISAPAGTGRVDQKTAYDGQAFVDENMFYEVTAEADGDLVGKMELVTDVDNAVIENMGESVATSYRLISVDGGATISYIISNPNVSFGQVTNYSEAKGTINASKALGSNNDLDDVVVYDGLKKGDFVVAKAENGKAVLYPTTVISGAATSWSKNTAVINGETYVGSDIFFADKSATTLAEFFSGAEGRGAARGANYVAFGNLLMMIDEDVVLSTDITGYAVVLKSSADDQTGDAVVKLGLSDGTEASYTVGYATLIDGTVLDAEEEDISASFADNQKFGYIVSYNVRNGKVELTEEVIFDAAQYEIAGEAIYEDGADQDDYYYANDNSTIFLLYTTSKTSRNVRFKSYNMMDMNEVSSSETYVFNDSGVSKAVNGAAIMPTSKSSNEVLMAVMTYGYEGTPSISGRTDTVGYIVNSEVLYNGETRKNYLNVSLISLKDKAVVSGAFEDAKNISSIVAGTYLEKDSDPYAIGSIANYAHDGEAFTAIDVDKLGNLTHQKMTYNKNGSGNETTGYFRATVADLTKTRISFYPYGKTALDDGTGSIDTSNLVTLPIDEYRYEAVAIVDDEADGDQVEEISKYDEVTATDYNAIIRVSTSGQVDQIFSLYGMIG